MVSAVDIALIREHTQTMPKDAVIVEMGPWLGAVSRELAGLGTLHVVDNFIWTDDHERRVPDMVKPGESFRPLFEKIMSVLDLSVVVHETQFADFTWDRSPINFVMLDSPKTPKALHECLVPIIGSLAPGARLFVKNGLHVKQYDMLVYADRLVHAGLFAYAPDNGKTKSNILMLEAAQMGPEAQQQLSDLLEQAGTPTMATAESSLGKGPYLVNKMIKLVEAGNLAEAYKELSALEPDMTNVQIWERLEPSINTVRGSAGDLAIFSEMLVHHNNPVTYLQPLTDIGRGPMQMLRSFWSLNADKPWRAEAFQPAILQKAMLFGYTNWANKLDLSVAGKDILDVGCGPGLHGLGYLALGANSYLGVDPELRMDKDRVKNLVSNSRDHFGWSPIEISQRMPPWTVRAMAVEQLDTDQTFDVALLLDVLAHVEDLDLVLAKIASLMRPEGEIVVRHKNFYCWNGHQQKPNKVTEVDLDNPEHQQLVDWNHIGWDAPPDHYISRMLNKAKLDDVTGAIERYFIIDSHSEMKLESETGLGRLTDAIRMRYPGLTDRDFETQSIFITGRVRPTSEQSRRRKTGLK